MSNKLHRPPAIVEVEWLDSVGYGGWAERRDKERDVAEETMVHWSIGYLLKRDKRYVALNMSYGKSSNTVDYTLQIPRQAIRAMVYVRK